MRSPLPFRSLSASTALALGALLAAPGGALAAQSSVLKGDGSPVARAGGVFEAASGTGARAAARTGARRIGYGGATRQGNPLALQATPSRRKVTLFSIAWSGSCSDGDEIGAVTQMPRMPAARTGDFRRKRTEAEFDGELVLTFVSEVSGRIRPARTRGTFRTKVTATDGAGDAVWRCESKAVRFSVPRAYAGLTAQGWPLALRVSGDGARVDGAVLGFEAGCDRPGYVYTNAGGVSFTGAAIDGQGRFDGMAEEARDLGDYAASLSRHLTGVLGAGRASGTLHARADILDKALGTTVDRCDSGEVRWTAVR